MIPNIPDNLNLQRVAGLLDHRSEEPEIEYKAWMDLTSAENKSKIAKHLCALSNYGGGWLVFGISDDGLHTEPHPGDLTGYSQDVINSIVSRYLHPAFHCNVHFVQSRKTGKTYPVVQIPPHGAQPICAKSDGPLVDKRRVGVSQGTHYIRVPGPSSVPIDHPDLWKQLLHRCVVRERDSLLTSISRLFAAPSAVPEQSILDDYIDDTILRWNELQTEGWLVDPKSNRTALGFQLLNSQRSSVRPVKLSLLKDSIREASNAVDAECSGLMTFDISHRGEIAPRVAVVGQTEGYEVAAIQEKGAYVFAPAYWRIMSDGVAAEVRAYHEDSDWVHEVMKQRSSRAWNPGAHLSPRFQAVRMYEFVLFVRHFSEVFSNVESVVLAADYSGLENRSIRDTRSGSYYSIDQKSSSTTRRVKVEVAIESLTGDGTASTAALLLNPMLRLFDGWEVGAEFIQKAVRDNS
ncbi:MAG: hypothetical protein GHHEDOFH_01599 [Pseudorhodoplanes sp.]|nr:hypothetical protein [Pseudorhodoplanes sp.]